MIFYFSGTGNSKWIAQTIAKALGDTAVNLMDTDPKSHSFTKDDYLGIVYPVYAEAAPPPVLEFAKQLKPNGAYTFAVSNYANSSGHSLQQLSGEYLPLHSGYGMTMPDNTSHCGKQYDNEDSSHAKLKLAPFRINQIIASLLEKEEGNFDAIVGRDAAYKIKTKPPVYWQTRNLTAPFSVTKDKCISCGLCQECCPSKAIEITEGYPVWVKDRCYQCMACICYCPTEAIEFGDVSQGVYRYTFEKYFPKAITKEIEEIAQVALTL